MCAVEPGDPEHAGHAGDMPARSEGLSRAAEEELDEPDISSSERWTRVWLQRTITVALIVVVIPALFAVPAFQAEARIEEGEPAPRTVVAPDLIRVEDRDATERARRTAADAVSPVYELDEGAQAAIVQRVRDAFAAVREARQPVTVTPTPGAPQEQRTPSPEEQFEALLTRLPMLDDTGLQRLITLSDRQLADVEREAVQVSQQLAVQQIRPEEIRRVVEEQLPTQIAVRSFPPETATTVVRPIIEDALRPTVNVNAEETAARREQAREDVSPIVRSFARGSPIVRAGEVVDAVQIEALRQRGLQGSDPWSAALRWLLASLVTATVVSGYLRTHRRQVWRSPRRLLLLAGLVAGYAGLLSVGVRLASGNAPVWLFGVPAGALSMLATILLSPPVGLLLVIPVAVLTALAAPAAPGVVAFQTVAAMLAVPFVSRLSARGDLRRAAWQSTLLYGLIGGVFAGVFLGMEVVPHGLAAGLASGVLGAVIVNGSLPFLESLFGLVTATSLLDLADRNHPLLRELEEKALGTYNHSIMVSTLAERACRAIGADALLASTAALYHDIGKIRRPHFFIENQHGVNPHDELEPEISAVIIQEHVTDGVEMGTSHRLPPEVVEGIATHHGTTLVSYFYVRALRAAGGDESRVDERRFRYPGSKPQTREMAVLMLCDCSEGAIRAAAQADRDMSRERIQAIVDELVDERIDDGQLDESALTFRDLNIVRSSIVDTLSGIYHPRIEYPERIRRGGRRPRTRTA